MKISITELKNIILEAKISASDSYLKKEEIRKQIQAIIQSLVLSSAIKTQEQLDEFFSTADMALNALKMVPIDIWKKMAKEKK